jgi:hypothetical protein
MRIKLKYIYNGIEIQISSTGKLKLSDIIKRSLSRKGHELNKFIEENDKDRKLEKCRICKTHYPPFNIECHIDGDLIIIDEFKPIKDKIYCYGLNKECGGIKMNSNSVEFISKTLLLSKEDSLKYIKDNNKSIFYRENWNNDDEYKKSQSRDIDYFKNKYGVGYEIKYTEYTNKISKSNSLEGYINKYGTKEGLEIFKIVNSNKDSMSFNYFLSKNNNDYSKSYYEYNNRLKSVSTNLESFVYRHGLVDGKSKYLDMKEKRSKNIKKNISLLTDEERVNKYAITIERLGIDMYNSWRQKVLVPITRASKESSFLFKKVMEEIDYEDIYVGIGDNKEYFIRDEFNQIFFYDFVIKSKKIIIEYNGIAFHPKFENLDIFKPIYTKLTPVEIYNRQEYKKDLAIKNGFRILEVWSDDDDNLKKCLNFIKKFNQNE